MIRSSFIIYPWQSRRTKWWQWHVLSGVLFTTISCLVQWCEWRILSVCLVNCRVVKMSEILSFSVLVICVGRYLTHSLYNFTSHGPLGTSHWDFCIICIQVRPTNLALFLRAHISINKACNPIMLGVKWKPWISAFQWCQWIWDLDLNYLRYVRNHDSNLDIETAQNDWFFTGCL